MSHRAAGESFERIHRSNLVQMGVLPLEFPPGQNAASLGMTGREVLDVTGIEGGLRPRGIAHVEARREDGSVMAFDAVIRLDTPADVRIFQDGGILPAVARTLSQ